MKEADKNEILQDKVENHNHTIVLSQTYRRKTLSFTMTLALRYCM